MPKTPCHPAILWVIVDSGMDSDGRKVESLYLVDGSSYIYRAFYALPYLSNSKGIPTNAVYGFTKMLLKLIKERKPDHLAVVFDSKGPTFREDIYVHYKAQRPEMPDELKPQISYIKEIVDALSIPVLEKAGYEADDIIGTIAEDMEREGVKVVIVTGDKDMLQLVNDHVILLDTMKDRRFGVEDVLERYGVEPEKVVEIMGLAGDSIDNIPGVPGIGEKTAVGLIKEFGSIEGVLNNIEKVRNRRVRENLERFREQAIMSRELASIDRDVPIDYSFEDLRLSEPDYNRLKEIFRELEFNRLLKEVIPVEDTSVSADYREVLDEKGLSRLITAIRDRGEVSIEIDGERDGFKGGSIKGIAVSFKEAEAYYIPVGRACECTDFKDALESPQIKKYGFDLKKAYLLLNGMGIRLSGMAFDTMIGAYLLNPLKSPYTIDSLGDEFLNRMPLPLERGETIRLCDLSQINYLLAHKLSRRLKDEGLNELFHLIELPLIEVLAEMEIAGIKVDSDRLHGLSQELQSEIERLEERIYLLAGRRFNINSPKQLQKVLFEDLKLKPVRRTKTGFSTDEGVLKQLSLSHELPQEILNFRHLAKLKATYIDALISLMDPDTGRIHTLFNQATTATGRLSSSEPNLQNIPIRSEFGRRIRGVFVAEEGFKLLSADYSQIELRIVAHLSKDPVLMEAFKKGEDIHRKTASEIFRVLPLMVSEEMRRRAKAINFGIIYGISPYGLSQNLGISQSEAKEYIENYFSVHRGVKDFIDTTLRDAEDKGYVSTMFGRKRPVPELKSGNPSVRGFGERIAINTPIQGSAADIIKKAMVDIHRVIRERGLRTQMVLQIHDELLFEVPEEELEEVREIVRKGMEGAVEMDVPVKVDIGTGKNWLEAH